MPAGKARQDGQEAEARSQCLQAVHRTSRVEVTIIGDSPMEVVAQVWQDIAEEVDGRGITSTIIPTMEFNIEVIKKLILIRANEFATRCGAASVGRPSYSRFLARSRPAKDP